LPFEPKPFLGIFSYVRNRLAGDFAREVPWRSRMHWKDSSCGHLYALCGMGEAFPHPPHASKPDDRMTDY
jgi:hypothetical protein